MTRTTCHSLFLIPDDVTRADSQAKGTTAGLGDAADETRLTVTPPAAPVDLTAEAASDTNALDDSDRGVFLSWNTQRQGDA